MQLFKVSQGVQVIAYIAYLLAVGVMTHTLMGQTHPWQLSFYLFPLLLLLALYVTNRSLKHVFAFAALSLFMLGGLIQPFQLDAVRVCLF
ncbi:MAG: GGDEF-domain containing protein, partial [Pseudomonadota bacterium]